jgi:hypothetical protein
MISKSVIYNKLHFESWSSNNRHTHTHILERERTKKRERKENRKKSLADEINNYKSDYG